MLPKLVPLVLTILLSTWLPACLAACYHPDKTLASNDYQPCFSDRPSMCCATNRNGDISQNKCRPDGLCWESSADGKIWRESCTDPTWSDPACLKLCMDTTSDVVVTTCGDGSYCCGFNQTTCCLNGGGFWISAGKVYPYNQNPFLAGTSQNLSNGTSAQGASNTGSESELSLSDKLAAARLGTGLGVGLGIGIPFILLLMVFALLMKRRRARNHVETAPPAAYHHMPYSPEYSSVSAAKVAHHHVTPHPEVAHAHGELASTPRMELEGDNAHKP